MRTSIALCLSIVFMLASSAIVINTWPFVEATKKAWSTLQETNNFLDALEFGLHECEILQCDYSVGYGGSPSEDGTTTLDAMIMNGQTREVGAVANLKNVKEAVRVARQVMKQTYHSILVGEDATNFAKRIGFNTNQNLTTERSYKQWQDWLKAGKIPNYWKNQPPPSPREGHDTIGMVIIDDEGQTGCGTSTNGLTFRVPGRIGDSAIPGSGCYVEQGFGASATGNGDFIVRFAPSMRAVMYMKMFKMHPKQACKQALLDIEQGTPAEWKERAFAGLVCVNDQGQFGASAIGEFTQYFKYAVRNSTMNDVHVYNWHD